MERKNINPLLFQTFLMRFVAKMPVKRGSEKVRLFGTPMAVET